MGSPHNAYAVDSHSNSFSPSNYVGTLEDIEQPAWISTTSFSESCGSCLSRISSLCLDGKGNNISESSEGRLVPDHFEKSDASEEVSPQPFLQFKSQNRSEKLGNVSLEEGAPLAVTGSLQSLSSSTKTVYASPRSNSEDEFYRPLTSSVTSEKAIRGSLYRERAPSENALDLDNLKSIRESKLSLSLHDVSSIPSNGLKKPCRDSRQSANVGSSLTALCMRNRSRDSGFIHSESLLSLSSAGRNYDHVESKVKQYIQSIKEADAVRRKERAKSRTMVSPSKRGNGLSESQHGLDMGELVQKMQYDMEEKDRILFKLQEDYNNLLGKYAEAENKIDKLRFGCHENNPSALQRNIHGWRTQPPNRAILKQLKQPSVLQDIDDSSLTSSMFLSNCENIESPNSSFHFEQECSMHINHKDGMRKEVVVSAPLRPISSLYCTSVRLNQFVRPLNSKSSVEGLSASSSQGRSPTWNNSKVHRHALDVTIREGTTDTGIDSFCHDEMSATPLPVKSEPISHLPHEDSILKVQRWQKSLHKPSHSELSPLVKDIICGSSTSYDLQRQKSLLRTSDTKVFSSIGVQTNLGDGVEFPSINSRMSTPMLPCLNLGELSGCTEEFSESLLSSEFVKKKPISQHRNRPSMQSYSPAVPDSSLSMPPNGFSSLSSTSCTGKQSCEGKCNVCGCGMKSERRAVYDMERRERKIFLGDNRQTSLLCKEEQTKKTLPQLSGKELAELLSMILKDQDHVVPMSPEEEKSNQNSFKTLERKIKSLKSSVNLQTFVSLLDVLLDKIPSEECSCHQNQNAPDQSPSKGSSLLLGKTEPSDYAGMDCSLLQCLEELDEYTNQVWAKTESFLEVLNSNKSAFKTE